MAKDKGGHGSEKLGNRFRAGGHIIEHGMSQKTGGKMYMVGSTGNAYLHRSDAEAYAKKYPAGKKKKY